MDEYTERFYRRSVRSTGLVTFGVSVKETDLLVSAEKSLEKETRDLVFSARHQIESYVRLYPEFLTTLKPYPPDPCAPPLVREMIACTGRVGVGPMASVAGAVAQYVGQGLLEWTSQVLVENGGDIFMRVDQHATVSVFAGRSPLSEKIGIVVPPGQTPLGICSSSATVGHSFSMGAADVACVLASSAVYADGAATALCNIIQDPADLNGIGLWAESTGEILGALVVLEGELATWGAIELAAL